MKVKHWDALPIMLQCDEVALYYTQLRKKRISIWLKRLSDLIIASILLVILSPLFLILAILIKKDSEGPVFYRQERITQYGRIFRIFKFRTMVCDADKIGSLITTQGDVRITKIGSKIRRYRLDEIPQLMNVIIGDMSLVGARPEVQKYVDAYSQEMRATLLLPAGVTSLASIKFKNEDKIMKCYDAQDIDRVYIEKVLPKKMVYNLTYITKFSFFYDMKICVETLVAVCRK